MLTGLISGGTAGASRAVGVLGGIFGVIPWLISAFMVTIDEGEDGFRQRNGRPLTHRNTGTVRQGPPWKRRTVTVEKGDLKVVGAGTHFSVPVLYSIRKVDTKLQSLDLPPKTIADATGTIRVFNASMEYRRGSTGKQMRQAELGVANEVEFAGNRVAEALQFIIENLPQGEFPTSREIDSLVINECQKTIDDKCGIIVEHALLTSVAKSPEQMQMEGMVLMAEAVRSQSGNVVPVPLSHIN